MMDYARVFSLSGQSRPAISRIDADPREHTAAEIAMARRDEQTAMRVGAHITSHYPNVLFRVAVDSPNGIIRLFHPLLPAKWGYTVHLREFNSDPSMRCITRACGELLERFNIPRGAYRRELWQEARERHWRTAAGIFPRVYDPSTKRMKTVIPDELRR